MTIEFDKIFIIESIADTIDNAPLMNIGNNLYRALEDKIIELSYTDTSYKQLTCKHFKVKGMDEWIRAFEQILEDCRSNSKPVIHLICHGVLNRGVKLADFPEGEFLLPWEKVMSYFESVNFMCKNHLYVTMCVCHGFWSMAHLLDDNHRVPFCGLLASPDAINSEEVGILLPAFYTSLFKDPNIEKAIAYLNKAADYAHDEGIPVQRWYFKFADLEFVKAVRADYEKRSTPNRVRKMAKKAFRAMGWKRVTERLIKKYIGENYKRVPTMYEEIRDYKFMFDIYPDEKKRFNLPETYNEIRFMPFEPNMDDYGELSVIPIK